MGKKKSGELPTRRLVAADDEGLASAMGRMVGIMSRLEEGETLQSYVARGSAVIEEHVRVIAEVLNDADAFDVIELMRLREQPLSLEGYRESLSDQLPAAVEVIALILLARGQRAPVRKPTSRTRPSGLIPSLHDRVAEMLTLGTFTLLDSGSRDEFGPLTSLSAAYVSHDLSVQFKQYSHVHDSINAALFATEHIGDLLVDALGFSYEDFCAVRDAVGQVLAEKFFAVRDAVADLAEHHRDGGDDPEFIARARPVLESFMHLPGGRATLTVEEISSAADVPDARTQRILDLFSLAFGDPQDPLEAVRRFLSGDNPFRSAALVRDGNGGYISTGKPIGTDCFRQVVEEALKGTPKFRPYERRRVLVSEQLALEQLGTLLGTEATYANLKYFRANGGVDIAELGPSATNITAHAEQTEADGLFIIEDVAVCVEVKAKSISQQARSGRVQRLSADLRETIGNATAQAMRLEDHIRTNRGLWLEDRTWLDLSGVQEVRSVTVFLDDFGPLATALDELVRAEVIKSERFPWIVTLHDLTMVAEVLERPAEFLLYLRRRTESEVSLRFKALDELDLFMLFVTGGLWVEPDPDRVSKEFLGVPRPTGEERRRYRESATPTMVSTHTDALDAWVYFQEATSSEPAPKPAFTATPGVTQIVNFLQEGRKPGWFRFSADLLNLGDEGGKSFEQKVAQIIAASSEDGRHHNAFMAFAGAWGYPTLFFGTQPRGMTAKDAGRKLATYGLVKKHQVKSDRALMVIFDESGRITSVLYDYTRHTDDPAMEEAAIKMGLIPPAIMARPIPPSARRPTARLNPTRKPKGRKHRR